MTFKIFRNAFLIGICVLLACSALFFGVMFSNYESQAFDKLAIEADYIAHAVEQIGPSYLDTLTGEDRITFIAPDGTVLFENGAKELERMSAHFPTTLTVRRSPRRAKRALVRARAIHRRCLSAITTMPCVCLMAACCVYHARRPRWRRCF